jgi:hypothetical protein
MATQESVTGIFRGSLGVVREGTGLSLTDLRVGIRRLAPDATPEQTQEAIRAAVRESLLWWNGAAGVYVRSGVVAG